MSRAALLVVCSLLGACNAGAVIANDTDTGDDPNAMYDGANLRITAPSSGDFLFLEEPHTFTAEVRDASGAVLPYDDIAWSSDQDAAWTPTGASFTDDTLAPGIHDLTAEAELPNGDRVAHTIGGVRLESKWAGTYAGLFTSAVHTQYQNTPITVNCTGAATIVVDLLGATGTGGSDCVIALNGVDVPAQFTFDLQNDDGVLTGTANVYLRITEIPYEATGSIDPDTHALTLTFGGDIPVVGSIEGGVDADRVSLDVE